MSLFLGIDRDTITPNIGGQLYGYRPYVISKTVADELTVTAFYFKNETTEALLISTTVCLLNTNLTNQIRKTLSEQTGIPTETIIITATHTHSGPNTAGEYGWGDIDHEYCNNIFIPRIIKTAAQAISAPVEVEMGIGIGKSEIGINRRELTENCTVDFGQNEWGAFNPQMTIISFRNNCHKPLANIIHYGMHGTCAGCNTEITRDWSGVMCDTLERESGAITAFFTGPEGDIGPRLSNGLTVGDISYVYQIGNIAGFDAVKIYRTITCYDKAPKLAAIQANMILPLAKRPSLEHAQKQYEIYKEHTVNIHGQKKDYWERVINSYRDNFIEKEFEAVPQNIMILGNIAFTAFHYELFSEIGMMIAKYSPFPHTLSLACANGNGGYFVTESAICRGGYEVDMFLNKNIQAFVNNADHWLIKETLKNLKTLYKED